MDIQVLYTETVEHESALRTGGVILKGKARQTRQPIHLILLIDTSGSMDSAGKLISVKKSIQMMLSFLSQEDRISLVSFADDSKCILSQAVPSTDQLQAIQYRIDSLRAGGSTNMSAALLEGRRLVESGSERKQGMILLTDGHANLGVKETSGLVEILNRIHTDCPSLTASTVAYGVDHNTDLLSSLAQTGGGGYNVVSSAEDVASVFGNILGGLVSISCQKVEVILPPGCCPMTSYPFTQTDNGIVVAIGDLYAETEMSVVFKHSPTLDPIRIKGVDMQTLNEIDVSMQPAASADIPICLLMAQYCYRVSDLLKSVSSRSEILTPALLKDLMNTLHREIRNDTRVDSHPLRDMLIQDLEHAMELLERRDHITQEDTVLLAQHSAYIGLSRGMPSLGPEDLRTPQAPRLRRQRRRNAFDSADHTMTSPLANGLQARYSEIMSTLVSQTDEEPQNVL